MKKRKTKAKVGKKAVKPIPAGYHTVTPYLACGDGDAAIEFYKKAFGAAEKVRMPGPDGKVVNDADALTERAVKAGAKLLRKVEDPFGHVWHLATHTEDLTMAELKKRAEKAMKA